MTCKKILKQKHFDIYTFNGPIFSPNYDRLAEQPRQFNPNSFRFSRLQSIINDNKKDNLTEEQLSLLNERRMVEHLEKENVFLSKILKTYRDRIIASQI